MKPAASESRNSQLVRVVGPDREAAGRGVEAQHELAGLEDGAVLLAEEGDQQLARQVAPVRLPVDVEPAGDVGVRAPFQHVEPPGVVGAADAHVVGHEVEDLAEAVRPERRDHGVERRGVAELGIEAPMVHDVVAMRAARPRLEIGRGIDVADAEPGEVGRERGGAVEAEPGPELEPVGGARRRGRGGGGGLHDRACGGGLGSATPNRRHRRMVPGAPRKPAACRCPGGPPGRRRRARSRVSPARAPARPRFPRRSRGPPGRRRTSRPPRCCARPSATTAPGRSSAPRPRAGPRNRRRNPPAP